MQNRIRIKDIAERAGVSKGTVDRVIHNRGNVSPVAREKVISAMEQLDYEPNVIARVLATKRGWRIAVLIPGDENDPFWEQPKEGIQRAQRALRDYGVVISLFSFRDADPKHFEQLGARILKDSYDALLVAPSFAREGHDLLDKCEAKGLCYVEINTLLERDHPCFLAYIGQDSYASGVIAAKLLNFELKKGETAMIMHLEKEVYNAKHLLDKQAGFEAYFRQHREKDLRVVQVSFGDVLDTASTESFVRNTLNAYPNTTGIFVTTSKLFRIVPFIRKYAKRQINLIGFDLIRENLDFLESEDITFLINQNPFKQGFMGIINLFNYLVLKKAPQHHQFLPLDTVMRENVKYYVEEQSEKLHLVI